MSTSEGERERNPQRVIDSRYREKAVMMYHYQKTGGRQEKKEKRPDRTSSPKKKDKLQGRGNRQHP